MTADELFNAEDVTEEILWRRKFLKCPECDKGYFYPTEECKNTELKNVMDFGVMNAV